MTDVRYAYDRPSQLVDACLDLVPSTPSEAASGPFFTGWVREPRLVAQLLLTVSAVARSRYFRPVAARLLDPILTSGDDRLRIESFSSCCGVYARADVLPGGLVDAD